MMSRASAHPRLRTAGLLALALFAACGEDSPGGEGGPRDQGFEPVTPPDIALHDGAVSANIGAPCDPKNGDADCDGGAECLDLSGGSPGACDLPGGKGCGVCVLVGCTVEDIETPAVEDTCPKGTACTVLPVVSGTETFCLQKCTPQPDSNPCAATHAGLTCHPASIVLNWHTEVCVYPACSADQDCGNKDPLKPDSVCLVKSGTCLVKGDPQAKVGDPCTKSSDCGPYQSCLAEQKESSGTIKLEGGYCTKIGCKYGDPQTSPDYWGCPPDSECFYMGSGQFVTFCLATTCDPTKPDDSDGCRDQASAGQYDCIELGTTGSDKVNVCWLNLKK